MIIIGLTGPTGAGKTTVLRVFESQCAAVIDCDALYHEMLLSDAQMLGEIKALFPACFPGGALDRKALGALVFSNPELLALLESVTHRHILDCVRSSILSFRKKGFAACVVDAIALFESGFDRECDLTVGVLAAPALRAGRIVARDGITAEYAQNRIKSQQPDKFYIDRCTFILHNDGSEQELKDNALKLFEKIMRNRPEDKFEN